MDAPMMVMRSHVPEDAGLRRTGEGAGEGHENKEHKPVLKKVKEKVRKIKDSIKSHSHGHEHGGHARDGGGNGGGDTSEEEEEGYQEDVEDKHIADPDLEVHGAPGYETTRIPAVQEVEGEDAPRVRLGDLAGPAVIEDPAAPHSASRPPRGGEDIGMTPVVLAFERMAVSEAQNPNTGRPEGPKEATAEAKRNAGYAEKLKSAAVGTTEYGKKLAAVVYDKVTGVGSAVAGKVQHATQSATGATVGGSAGEQDKGVSVKEYIAQKLRPGEEDKALSEVIAGAVQRRKEDATVAVPRAAQVAERVRGAVTSLAGGGIRETDTLQATTGGDVKEAGSAVEGPELRGQGTGAATTTM